MRMDEEGFDGGARKYIDRDNGLIGTGKER